MNNTLNETLNNQTVEYLRQFRKPVTPLLEEMEKYAEKNQIPIVLWQTAELLELHVSAYKPARVLEFGTAIGYSAIRMASASETTRVTTIEKSPRSVELASHFIHRAGLSARIEILSGEAEHVAATLAPGFGMIFLDADKKDYLTLLELSLPLLNRDGLYIADNLLWHGYTAARNENVPESYRQSTDQIREFNKVFFNHPSLQSVLLPVGDGIGVARKN